MTAGRERYARLAAANAMEARDPFLDRRIVDYCSRLPGHVFMKDGWPKALLRQLMVDRLPDEVVWCRGKPHLGWLFNEIVTRLLVDRDQYDLSSLQSELKDFVDREALARAWQSFSDGKDAEQIHSAVVLAVWLRENGIRPVVPG
jgi:asparagine synthase (glutamine-hydrolysing)